MMSKLDEMLLGYKSIPDNDPITIPIIDDFYRKTNKSKSSVLESPFESENDEASKAKQQTGDKNKMGGFNGFKNKNDKLPKFSLIMVKLV